jgi:hypothetical protein
MENKKNEEIKSAQNILLTKLKYEVFEVDNSVKEPTRSVIGVMPKGTIVVCGECNEGEDSGGGSSGQCT